MRKLLVAALAFALCCVAQRDRSAARLIRVYDGPATELVDLSADGQLLVTRGFRAIRCADGRNACTSATLSVYRTDSGARVGGIATSAEGWVWYAAVGFSGSVVEAVQDGPGAKQVLIEWDPRAGSKKQFPLPNDDRLRPTCVLSTRTILAMKEPRPEERRQPTFVVIDQGQQASELSQPDVLGPEFDCNNWRSGNSFLVEGADGMGDVRPVKLFTLFADPVQRYKISPYVPGETTHGHAISRDGSTAVVITSADCDSDGVMGPSCRVFLNVLDHQGARTLRVQLEFPEKPKQRAPLLAPKNKYFAGARFAGAWRVAISPDTTKMAIGYGVRTGGIYSDAVAFFGIYSLPDGRRLATLKGDTYKNGIRVALRDGDLAPTTQAPLEGALLFSPDSRTLYACSKRIWQWDVSGLR